MLDRPVIDAPRPQRTKGEPQRDETGAGGGQIGVFLLMIMRSSGRGCDGWSRADITVAGRWMPSFAHPRCPDVAVLDAVAHGDGVRCAGRSGPESGGLPMLTSVR
jgi:hypothetical protein